MVMSDLTIIGGGYWGAAICYEARQLGWTVEVFDDGDRLAGSRNASAICDPKAYSSSVFKKYWPASWTKADLDESLDWLVKRGGKVVEENFWNLFQKTAPRKGGKAIYLPSNDCLTRLALPLKKIEVNYNLRPEYRRLVIAAGYRTPEVMRAFGLTSLEVGKLYGRGIVATGRPLQDLPVSVMIKPYTKHTVRPWGSNFRIGDTAESYESPNKLPNLRRIGKEVLEGYFEFATVEGFRPSTPQFFVEKVAPSVVVATGGNRVGLGLAGLVAKKVLEALR